MGLILSGDFIDVANSEIVARSVATGYAKINIMDQWHLKRRLRMDDLTKSDTNPILRLDMGTAQTVTGIFLNDVNFDTVRIRGHGTDLGTDWSTSRLLQRRLR